MAGGDDEVSNLSPEKQEEIWRTIIKNRKPNDEDPLETILVTFEGDEEKYLRFMGHFYGILKGEYLVLREVAIPPGFKIFEDETEFFLLFPNGCMLYYLKSDGATLSKVTQYAWSFHADSYLTQ